MTINQKPVTITASSPTVTYGDAVPAITPSVTLVNSQTLATPGVMTTQPTCVTAYTTATHVAATTADRQTSCSGAVAANYAFSYTTGVVTINRKGVTVTASSPTVTYGDAIPTITPTYVGWVNGEDPTVLTSTPTCSTVYTTATSVAATTANRQTSCVGAAAVDYSFTYPTGVVTVQKKGVAVTASSPTVSYGDAVPTISASYSGFINGATSSVVSSMSCTTTYTVTTNVGTTPTTACASGTATDYSFTYTGGTVTINQKTVTITASSHTVQYGAAVPTVTASYSGFVNSQTQATAGVMTALPTCSTAYTTATHVGAALAGRATTCSGASAGNYAFAYTDGAVTVNQRPVVVTASSASVSYGDAIPTITPAYAGLQNSETSSVFTTQPVCTTTYTTSTNFGVTPTTSCSGAVAGDYSFSYTGGTVTIARKGVAITAASITPTYGDAIPTVTASYSGFVNGQTQATPGVMTTLPTCSTTYTTSTTVAAGGTTSCSGAVAPNYSFTYTAGTATVQRKLVTVTPTSPTVTYGDSIPTITVLSYAGWKTGESQSVLTTAPTCSTTYTTASAVASTPTTVCVGAAAANYSFAYPTGTVTIQRKAAVITAASPGRTYGDNVPAITYSYSGLVNSENGDDIVTSGPNCTTSYVSTSAYGTTPTTTCTGAAAANYTFSYGAGAIAIAKRPVTVTASSPTVTYGDPVPSISPAYSAFSNGETSSVVSGTSCTTGYTRTTAVAVAPTTTCSGSTAANYSFSYTAGAVTIQRAPLTVTASSPAVTYGDPVPTVTPSYAGLVNGESGPSVVSGQSCSTAYAVTSDAGTTPATSCAGGSAANYSISYTAGRVTIGRATLHVTASSPTVTYGDPVPSVSPQYADLLNGDSPSVVSGQSCATAYAPTSHVATTPATTCSGGTAGNYTLAYTAGAVTIQRAPLAVTASSATLTYGDAVPAIAPGYVGFRNGDTASVVGGMTCATTYTPTTDAGQTPATTCHSGTAADYVLEYTAGSITVLQSSVSISWPSLAPITYETPLSGTQLGATASDTHGDVSGVGTFAYSLGGEPLAQGDVLPAGTHTLHVEYTPLNGVSYSTAARNVTLVVNKAPQSLVTGVVAATRVYGQTTTLTAGSHSGTGAITHQVVSGPCSVTGATLRTTGAGTCRIRSTIATDANYLPQTSTPISVSVAKAPLMVTALDAHRRRATPDPVLQYAITGWVGTDDENVLTAPVSVTRVPGDTPGTYAITATGADAADYSFAYTPGTFTVVEKDFPTITWAAPAAITYGTTLSATQLNPSAAFGGTDVPGTYAYAEAGTPVAAGTLLPAGTHVLTATFTPTNTDDYQSGLTQQVTLTVRRKELTVAGVTAADRLFDETAAARIATTDAALVGVVGADDVTLDVANAVAVFDDALVGEGKRVTISGMELVGADIANYTLSQPTATARIRATVPGRPTGVTGTPGDRSAVVEWSAPAFTGGTPVTGYTVTASPGGASCSWTSGPLRCTVTGLENTGAYTFTVTATNAIGTGEASSPSGSVTPATPMAASVESILDAGLDVRPDGTIEVDLGCAGASSACSVQITLTVDDQVVATGTSTAQSARDAIILSLSPELQRELARRGTLTVKVTISVAIDGFKVKLSSMITLEAPPAQIMRALDLKPTAEGGADLGAQCFGRIVQRCSGEIALYAEPAVLSAVSDRAQKRVLIGDGDFGGAAGEAVNGGAKLSAAGRAYLQQHGSMRVVPVLTFKGGTRFDGTLPKGFTLTMLTPRDWLLRAVRTLSVGGRPRLDLNLLLDAVAAGSVSHRDAARTIEREIIPRRLAARRRVDALPLPPASLRRVVVLLERSFDRSVAANRAYVRWLRSGQASDPIGWRYSLRATATKRELIALLNALGKRYGISVPAENGLWP